MIKKIIIGLIIFGIGLGFGASAKTTTPATTEKVKTVEVEKNLTEWQSLKSIDDEGFTVSAENMELCNAGFKAVVNLDTDEMNRVAKEITTNTGELNNLATRRQEVLKKLGY